MKKSVCLLLCIIMLLSVLFSCSSEKEDTSSAPSVSTASDTSEGGGQVVYKANVPEGLDLEGRVFRVLCRDYSYGSTSVTGYNGEVIQRPEYSEETAGVVDLAKAEVRRRVEEQLNCTITGDFNHGNSSEFNNVVRNGVL